MGLSFSHSLILSFSHSLILSFSHSLILSCSNALMLSCPHSLILSFSHSLILSFNHALLFSSSYSLILSFSNSQILSFFLLCLPISSYSCTCVAPLNFLALPVHTLRQVFPVPLAPPFCTFTLFFFLKLKTPRGVQTGISNVDFRKRALTINSQYLLPLTPRKVQTVVESVIFFDFRQRVRCFMNFCF